MPISYPQFVPADVSAFRARYRNFAPLLERADLLLWSELNNEASFSHMRSATECWEFPAVAGVTRQVADILKSVPDDEVDYIKQGIGAMVCCIMEKNGYVKTGIKRSVPPVPRRLFSRGEVYKRLAPDIP